MSRYIYQPSRQSGSRARVAKGINIGEHLEPAGDCEKCKRLACICPEKERHHEHCWYLQAVSCSAAIECPHGHDVCPQCDPCTCRLNQALTRRQSKFVVLLNEMKSLFGPHHFSTTLQISNRLEVEQGKVYRELKKLRSMGLAVQQRTGQYIITDAGQVEADKLMEIAREVCGSDGVGPYIFKVW